MNKSILDYINENFPELIPSLNEQEMGWLTKASAVMTAAASNMILYPENTSQWQRDMGHAWGVIANVGAAKEAQVKAAMKAAFQNLVAKGTQILLSALIALA